MDMELRRFTSNSKEINMKLKRCASTSLEIVLDKEDLLTLILLRLPYRQLISFKTVSKKWLSLITSPHFIRLLRNVLPPLRASGLFVQRFYLTRIPRIMCKEVFFVPLDNPNATSPFRNLTFAHDSYTPHQIYIMQSCNGLLLCNSAHLVDFHTSNYYVYNPSTNYLDTLPKHPLSYGIAGYYIGLTYDPSKSLHYKVIAFVTTSRSDFVGDFHTYSSETRNWKASIQTFSPPLGTFFGKGVYWNGCMHWLCFLSTAQRDYPDSAVSDCLYFNVDEERFGKFPRPPIGARKTSMRSLYFGESGGYLHVTEVCPYATSLSVYEMNIDYSGWFVK